MNKLKTLLILGVSSVFLLAACDNGETENSTEAQDDINYSEEVDYTITGIEPGAGITEVSYDTIDSYDNLAGWNLEESSTAGMLAQLDDAIKNEEPIVFTGWVPHHMFIEYDLKMLDDPQNTMGDSEAAHTITRLGLEEDMPSAYEILDAFNWELDDVEEIMYEAENLDVETAASDWMEDNQDKVAEWTENVEEVNGEEIELVTMPWEAEQASAAVMEQVLSDYGYDVTVTEVDPAILFESIAGDSADASVAPALPVTQGHLYDKHEDEVVDLGSNLEGLQNGFVVPEYMDIDSIEDLEPKE
ncbi:MAG: glycine/betaine ABC transporter [Tetragenococcus halophilus]|uniref:glycine betaine ABC transporter substrate-binding protein n=1 Tax=Tetragenococcus halophilus TaxID=51669 RepID=UPI001F3D4173|nr:glycine betaine ABC transporter substrate-binding protein [Tetragenococcus halophilus]MCF1676838.1 glycine/betaine ABC transporter [Tetragenococcus halophilus]MDN6291772.1 glycine/betaine ABC transporter [Tetragenococcus halophilus]